MRYPELSPYEVKQWRSSGTPRFMYRYDPMGVIFAKDMIAGVVFYPKIIMDGEIEPDTEWYVDSVPIVKRKLVGHKSRVAMVPRQKGQSYGQR